MMKLPVHNKRTKGILLSVLVTGVLLIIFSLVFVNRIIEPVIQNKLQTLVIQGSDSLYTYRLGNLDANFFAATVEVENLQIQVDSNRYKKLAAIHKLPSLTMQINLVKGYVKGISILPLLLNKKIKITEILSKGADIKLMRHTNTSDTVRITQPLWKVLRPSIKSISIARVNLDGIKLLYKYADTSEAIKLQFDHCVALLNDVRIDSAASADTQRVAFAKILSITLNDLKYRTGDSSHKMKAEVITYSSASKILEVREFKIQPTLRGQDFFKKLGFRESWHLMTFESLRLTNFKLDKFFHNNTIAADSAFVVNPDVNLYMDKTYLPSQKNKIGNYPHQDLLNANPTISIKGVQMYDLDLLYTEKSDVTLKEGKFFMNDVNVRISNVTNDPNLIKKNSKCIAVMEGSVLRTSPFSVVFTFHLDSANGAFDANGVIENVSAAQLNGLSEPLASIYLQSFNMHKLNFAVKGDDYTTSGNVRLQYNNLSLVFRKFDKQTGITTTKGFLT
ncbi:MAG: hypothetical protein ABR502_01520, partial [Chitinophagaceae bacterium]